MNRKLNEWDVVLATPEGTPQEVKFRAYWGHDKVETAEVAEACCIETIFHGPRDSDGQPRLALLPVSATPVAA